MRVHMQWNLGTRDAQTDGLLQSYEAEEIKIKSMFMNEVGARER